jgi:arginyl-tRNA synthetase
VGRDATRFFFVMRKPDSQLVFDIDLAKQQSVDNPVYYVQYAHARIHGIFGMVAQRGAVMPGAGCQVSCLVAPEELDIIKTLAAFPATVEGSAQAFEPHRITYYLQELASQLHSFYNKHRVISEDQALTTARLHLLQCVAQTIRNALALLGVSAPEKM